MIGVGAAYGCNATGPRISIPPASPNYSSQEKQFVSGNNLILRLVGMVLGATSNKVIFSLGALGANGQVQFQIVATAETAGIGLSVAASVGSPDSNLNNILGSTHFSIL